MTARGATGVFVAGLPLIYSCVTEIGLSAVYLYMSVMDTDPWLNPYAHMRPAQTV